MKQNINLFQTETGRGGNGLDARVVLSVWAITMGAALIGQAWLGYRNSRVEDQLQVMQTGILSAEEQLNVMTAAIMAGSDPVLEAQLNEALRELDLRETILGLVSGTTAGDIKGFSGQLLSLARQQANGVWLTRIRISAPGARTALEGRALSPEAVPLYLQQLSGEAALSGQGFDVFEIRRPKKPGEAIRFSLNRSDNLEPVRLVRE